MYNQFRTLLLNLSDVGNADEHITQGYIQKRLPAVLQAVHEILFPKEASREYKLFLLHNYMNIIEAAGLTKAVKKLDPRITYDITDQSHFQAARNSNPSNSDPAFPLFVHGDYKVTNHVYSDRILVQQNTSNKDQISVFSYGHKSYVVGSGLYPDRTFITVNFTESTISDEINLEILGIRLRIGKITGNFTDTGTKVWEFLIDAPKVFEFEKIFKKLESSSSVKDLLSIKTSVPSGNYDNYWTFHKNPVYKLAGLLIAFVYRVNDL